MRRICTLDGLIGMLERSPPSLLIHEAAGVGQTCRQLTVFQVPKRLAMSEVFFGVFSLGTYAVKIDAKRILGRRVANVSVPSIVLPCDAQIKLVLHCSSPPFPSVL